MNKYATSAARFAISIFIALIAFQIESCTSHKAMVSCPDLHSSLHRDKTSVHRLHWHNTGITTSNGYEINAQADNNAQATPARPQVAPILTPEGIASIANEVPVIKNGKDLYMELTSEERTQAKEELSKIFSKNKMVKAMVIKKLDKLDKKYPAPAQSAQYEGGGLTLGEILAIVAIACAATWVLGLVGLVIGIVALVMINREGGRNWARILSIVAIVLGLAFLSFFTYVGVFIIR